MSDVDVVWIKYEAHHGPGHQSHTVEYVPVNYLFTDADLEIMLEGWSNQFNNVSSTAEIVRELPPEIARVEIANHKARGEFHQQILDSLEPVDMSKNLAFKMGEGDSFVPTGPSGGDIVEELLKDLNDRRGFDLGGPNGEVRGWLREAWTKIIRPLAVKARWHEELIEWLRLAHPEVHADYMKRIMAVHRRHLSED